MDFAIGELARRTGLTVKTIRFYSDRGLVPPCRRETSGRRRYDHEAVARLALIRTLRELGLDLATIGRVLHGEAGVAEVAAAQVHALDVQMRVLRLRRAVASEIAVGAAARPERVRLLLDLVAGERERLIGEFLDAAFAGHGPAYAGIRRSLTPELPEEPTSAQWDAWIELMSLVAEAEFRDGVRAMVAGHAATHDPAAPPRRDPVAAARDLARPLLAAGVDPESPAAGPAVAALTAEFAGSADRLLDTLRTARDARWDRYNNLLSVVNGWAPAEPTEPALDWFTRALAAERPAAVSGSRHRPARRTGSR